MCNVKSVYQSLANKINQETLVNLGFSMKIILNLYNNVSKVSDNAK